MFGNLLFQMFSLSLAFHEPLRIEDMNKVYWDFDDILRTTEHCVSLRNDILLSLHPRNQSTHIERLLNDLYGKYMELVSHNVPFVFIKQLLGLYCKTKIEEARVWKLMKAPDRLKGNFTWNFTDDIPENNDYHKAKFKEQVIVSQFEAERRSRILEGTEETEETRKELRMDLDWLKNFYRVSAYLIMFNLAVNIHNVLRIYYQNDDEEVLEDGEGDMRVELAQIGLMCFSLLCIFITLCEFE